MKIKPIQIYEGKLYCRIDYKNGGYAYALGIEQVKELMEEAIARGEKVELETTGFVKELSELEKLVHGHKKIFFIQNLGKDAVNREKKHND